ncbi:MAG: NADH-quinone oxidoreductase subunit H, partial [Gammaproteobacteria bacterium]
NMIIIAVLTSVMFFGGWLSPFQGVPVIGESSIIWLLAKTSFFLFMFLWLRATFPRYRYDQIMRLGWKIFIPITIVWLIVASVMVVTNMPWWFD